MGGAAQSNPRSRPVWQEAAVPLPSASGPWLRAFEAVNSTVARVSLPLSLGSGVLQRAAIFLILLPFFAAGYVLFTELVPSQTPDASAYAWRGMPNWGFVTGRSLTQRIAFLVSRKFNLGLSEIQLAAFAVSALFAWRLLRTRQPWLNLALAAGIAFVYSSYTLSVSAVTICAEPIHIALMVVFPAVLLRLQSPIMILGVGVLYTFSKNTAPYSTLVILVSVVALGEVFPPRTRRALSVLAACALVSLVSTQAFDTSLEIAVLNNASLRVFPQKAVTDHFHERYGMPVGPFVDTCAAKDVCATCFDGESLLGIDDRVHNYYLKDDRYGFADWARRRGSQAWTQYLLLDNPQWTFHEFRSAFEASLANRTVAFPISYMDYHEAGNLERLANGSDSLRRGWFGFDPLVSMSAGLGALGFGSLGGVAVWVAVGLALHARKHSWVLALGVTMVVNALALFFLGHFGDGMELQRHVAPALIGYVLGATVLFVGIARSVGVALLAASHRRATAAQSEFQ